MNILSNFAESISDVLYDLNITLDEFACKVKINVSEVYRYKRKECLPSTANIIKIADELGCSVDGLLGYSPLILRLNLRSVQTFSERFTYLLQNRGLTRYKLCKDTKLSPSRVDDWYNGVRLPSISNLIILKDYLDCTIDCLLGRE